MLMARQHSTAMLFITSLLREGRPVLTSIVSTGILSNLVDPKIILAALFMHT